MDEQEVQTLDDWDDPAAAQAAAELVREANERAAYEPPPHECLREALQRAMAGDDTALPEVRRWLRETGVWKTTADLGRKAERAWIALVAGEDVELKESLAIKLKALRDSLAEGRPSALETLVIEQVALAWLETTYVEVLDPQSYSEKQTKTQHDHLMQRVERGHRRLMAGLKTLATLRKLRPAPSPLDLLHAVPETAAGEGRHTAKGRTRLRSERVTT
jgi:hypothetical protein